MLRCGSCFCMSSLFHRVSDDSSWHIRFSLQVETLPRLQAHVPISSIRFVFLKFGSSLISPRAFRLAKFSFSSWILFDNYRWGLKCFQARLFVIVFLTSLFVPQEKIWKTQKQKTTWFANCLPQTLPISHPPLDTHNISQLHPWPMFSQKFYLHKIAGRCYGNIFRKKQDSK